MRIVHQLRHYENLGPGGLLRRSPRSVLIMGTVGLVVAGLMALLALGLLNQAPVTGMSGFTRVQKPAPDFTMPLVEGGGDVSLSEYQGQPVVINFWSSWCPPCRQEAPILEGAWRSYRDQGVVFVGVDIQDSDDDAKAYLQAFGITYPNGADRDGRVTVDYGVIGLPVTFFVNRDGIVERRWVGAIGEARLVAWVGDLVAAVAPTGETEGENRESFFEFE